VEGVVILGTKEKLQKSRSKFLRRKDVTPDLSEKKIGSITCSES
jgi:hypothetical protein